MSQSEVSAVDAANDLLTERPAQMATKIIDTPAGQRLLVTIRTETTTLTIVLAKSDADTWIGVLRDEAAKMSSLVTIPPGLLPKLNGHGKPS